MGETVSGTSQRMSARHVLKDKINRKARELNALEILDRVIEWDSLSSEEEEKLWDHFVKYK